MSTRFELTVPPFVLSPAAVAIHPPAAHQHHLVRRQTALVRRPPDAVTLPELAPVEVLPAVRAQVGVRQPGVVERVESRGVDDAHQPTPQEWLTASRRLVRCSATDAILPVARASTPRSVVGPVSRGVGTRRNACRRSRPTSRA